VIALIRFFVVPGAVVPWKAQPPGVKWSVNRDLVSVAAASQKKFCRRPLVDITGQTADSVLQPLSASDGVHILAAPRLNALARPVAATVYVLCCTTKFKDIHSRRRNDGIVEICEFETGDSAIWFGVRFRAWRGDRHRPQLVERDAAPHLVLPAPPRAGVPIKAIGGVAVAPQPRKTNRSGDTTTLRWTARNRRISSMPQPGGKFE